MIFMSKLSKHPSEYILAIGGAILIFVGLILIYVLQGQFDNWLNINIALLAVFFLGMGFAFFLSIAIHARFKYRFE